MNISPLQAHSVIKKHNPPQPGWNNYKQTLHLLIHYPLCIPIIAVTFKKKGFSTKARHATDLLSHNRRGRRNGSIYSARHRDAVQRLGKWRAVGAIESRRVSKCFFVFSIEWSSSAWLTLETGKERATKICLRLTPVQEHMNVPKSTKSRNIMRAFQVVGRPNNIHVCDGY